MSADKHRFGVYWQPAIWDLARSAYLSDLDTDPSSPDTFLEWLARALDAHARLTPADRVQLVNRVQESADSPQAGGRSGTTKSHPLPVDLLERVDQALVRDRTEQGRLVSRSAFVQEAVAAAAATARKRRGRPLPPPPATLAQRPPRALR